jgi:glycosyltransferase involved in cell wall biosynthesis
MAQSLGILSHVDILPKLDEHLLAAAYRRSAILLQTSESEGFGLPVIEAMACGTPVVVTDIAPLREVGGSAATYCPLGDTPQFAAAVLHLLQERNTDPTAWQTRRNSSLAHARQFTWSAYALRMTEIYSRIVAR